MKSVIPSYTLIIGYVVLIMMGVSLISVQAQISTARDVHISSLNQIQATHYDKQTINQISNDIQRKYGWTLEVSNQSVFKDRKAVRITLKYKIIVPFLNVPDKSASISAYGN